jgi:UDP-N-acetylenolpyruvoylglucosamine reductase
MQKNAIRAGGAEIFKNPVGQKKAWQLIEESGCKNMSCVKA